MSSILRVISLAFRFAVVFPLSIIIFTHERELVPLYGSGPTSYLLNKAILTPAIVSSLYPLRISLSRNLLFSAVALTLAPNATFWIAVWSARWKKPILGPAIVHTSTLGPLVFLLMGNELETVAPRSLLRRLTLRLVQATSIYFLSISLAQIYSRSSIFYNISDSQLYLALAGLFYSLWIISLTSRIPSRAKSKTKTKDRSLLTTSQKKVAALVGFVSLWRSLYPFFENPILPHPLPSPYVHPTFPLQILFAEQSTTGLITVGQWLPPENHELENDQDFHSARYLRASHSILGGVWTHDKVYVLNGESPSKDSFGTPLGDSIYSTFVLQEAARLVNSTEKGNSGTPKEALVIGLGAGISASAFIRHGISTTIVEIDPAVYKAARLFFGLPHVGSDRIHLEDARAFVSQRRADIEAGKNQTLFDIVIHDCFSGGGVPEHIFTVEFWDELKRVMQTEGILVVNFAGIPSSESFRFIINTLEWSFGQCRALYDQFEELPTEKYDTGFINIVLFCVRSPSPLIFRTTQPSDWLGSPLRRHMLTSLETREIDLNLIRDTPGDARYVLTDKRNALGLLQKKQGNHHWIVMREVLPNVHWETF